MFDQSPNGNLLKARIDDGAVDRRRRRRSRRLRLDGCDLRIFSGIGLARCRYRRCRRWLRLRCAAAVRLPASARRQGRCHLRRAACCPEPAWLYWWPHRPVCDCGTSGCATFVSSGAATTGGCPSSVVASDDPETMSIKRLMIRSECERAAADHGYRGRRKRQRPGATSHRLLPLRLMSCIEVGSLGVPSCSRGLAIVSRRRLGRTAISASGLGGLLRSDRQCIGNAAGAACHSVMPGRQIRSLATKVAVRHERAHLDVRQRPVLFAVTCDVPLNVVGLSAHDRFFAHAGL